MLYFIFFIILLLKLKIENIYYKKINKNPINI